MYSSSANIFHLRLCYSSLLVFVLKKTQLKPTAAPFLQPVFPLDLSLFPPFFPFLIVCPRINLLSSSISSLGSVPPPLHLSLLLLSPLVRTSSSSSSSACQTLFSLSLSLSPYLPLPSVQIVPYQINRSDWSSSIPVGMLLPRQTIRQSLI